MSAETENNLTKVDSAVQGITSPPEKRRASSSVPGVYNIIDLGKYHCRRSGCLWTSIGADSSFRKGGNGTSNRERDAKAELVSPLTSPILLTHGELLA